MKRGFTLIELLIVIGILSVLATVVLMVLNPAQMMKESRDSNRMAEIQNINKALLLYQGSGGTSMGTTNKIYVSLPSAQTDCSDLGLPSPGAGYTYACSNSANYRKIDGTGWIPVDFTSVQSTLGNVFSNLPVDPVNTVADGYYYTYIVGSWTVSATLESTKFLAANASNDGGQVANRFEVGNHLALNANLPSAESGGTIYATGGTITTDGAYTVHTFTSSGTFTVTSGEGDVSYLVVAGGGSGATGGGGGGAGAVRTGTLAVTAQAYSITVGAGGASVPSGWSNGNKGSDSVFSTITSEGGGYGAHQADMIVGGNGGSGGGGGYGSAGGTGSAYGHNGGAGTTADLRGVGGGGGAGEAGSDGTTNVGGGDGGDGIASSISGTSVYYGGGGGGANFGSSGTNGVGGLGGGGAAGGPTGGTDKPGVSGTANTGGGGGGGGGSSAGGAGGSGIVIVRYLTP